VNLNFLARFLFYLYYIPIQRCYSFFRGALSYFVFCYNFFVSLRNMKNYTDKFTLF